MPSFKIIVGTLFGLLISAVIVLGVVSYRYNEQVVDTSLRVNQTYLVILAADEMSSVFRDLQLESNAIFVNRDTGRISNYRFARAQIAVRLEEMEDLARSNSELRPLIDSLTELTTQLVAFADMALSNTRALNADEDIVNRVMRTSDLRDRIALVLTRVKNREFKLLSLHEAENSRSVTSFNRSFSQLLAGISMVIVVAFFSIRYNFNKLIRIDNQLRIAQENTEKALVAEIELSKLKSNFVALASHEFRTPLTTILSSASLLDSYSFGENQAKVAKHTGRIKSSVNSLTSILDEFLSLSKIEEGRVVPNFEHLDIRQHLQNCIANLQNFAKPGQTIRYSHLGNDEVETDPVFIANIINNLVTNSIKYSPENAPIFVTSHVNDGIQLVVRDMGIGIPEEDQKHLFERFHRASNAGTVQGTGLGLHIMKHYVDMLNGTVEVKSEVGKGTTVFVTLTSPALR